MFSRFFNKKNDSSPEESDPIPTAAPASSLVNDSDFEHVGNDTNPSVPSLYPGFNRFGIQTQQSIDKGPHQCLMGVPFKLASIVLTKNGASLDAQQFQIREIMMRMRNNLDSPAQLNYEFNAERNVLQNL